MLSLKKQNLGETTIVRCSGRIVFPDAQCLRAAVLQLPRTRKLVLDMSDVITVDAAGLGALVSLYHWARNDRTELKLMNVSSRLQTLLRMTRLDEVLEICSAREILGLLYCSADEDGMLPFDIQPSNGERPEQESAVGG